MPGLSTITTLLRGVLGGTVPIYYGTGYVPVVNASGPNVLLTVGEAVWPGFTARSPADRRVLVQSDATRRPLYLRALYAALHPDGPTLEDAATFEAQVVGLGPGTFGGVPFQDSRSEGSFALGYVTLAAIAAAFVFVGITAGPALLGGAGGAGTAATAAGAGLDALGALTSPVPADPPPQSSAPGRPPVWVLVAGTLALVGVVVVAGRHA